MYRTTLNTVYGYARGHTGGDRAAAEDAVAETYMDAARHIAAGRRDEITIPWLKTVVRRRVVDGYRREERLRRRVDRLAATVRVDASAAAGPEEAFDAEEVRHAVMAALAALPPAQRTVLLMKYVDEASVQDIADTLDRSVKSVESLLYRARGEFKDCYSAQLGKVS